MINMLFANAEHGSDDAFPDVNFIVLGNELQYNCNGKFREKRFRRARAEIETAGASSRRDLKKIRRFFIFQICFSNFVD